MKFFSFAAGGQHFDVDGYLSATQLRAGLVYHKGEKRGWGQYPSCGFIIELGDENALRLHEQFEIACKFLLANRAALARLVEWPGFETASLGLSPEIKFYEGLICTGLFFPEEIVKLAGELNLVIGFSVRVSARSETET